MLFEGPSELSINDPNSVPAINSASSPCTKGSWYNFTYPHISLHTTREKGSHAQRRKAWDHAFSSKGKYIGMKYDIYVIRVPPPSPVNSYVPFYSRNSLPKTCRIN